MTDFLKGVGTTEVARDSLNMDVNHYGFCFDISKNDDQLI